MYRKDNRSLLQMTDKLYTAELLEIPGNCFKVAGRKAMLWVLKVLAIFVKR